MEIIDRKENPLLNRVEIEFRWNHEGKATPSRVDMLNELHLSSQVLTAT